jgi:amino acid transporter
VGPWGLAASIVSTLVGAGIFVAPAGLGASAGVYAPLAFVVCGVAIGAVAVCFAEGGSRVPTSGGAYGYIEAAFGPLVSYVAGTLLCLSDALACGSIAAALADVVASALPTSLGAIVRGGVIVGSVGGIALVNANGVGRGASFVRVMTLIKLVPLVLFVAVGAAAVHEASFAHAAAPSTTGLGRAFILALFALTGMESPLSASGEVAQPSRAIPRAIGIAMVSTTILYVAIQVIAQGILGASLATSSAPLADAMARVHPALRVLMLAGAGLSMFGWIGSDVLGTPRVLFALARDGLLPRMLGRVHPRSRAPHVAIFTYAAISIGLALSGTFAELAVLSTLAVMPLYIAGSIAAWSLARRGVAREGEPLGFRWLGAAMVIGTGSMLALIALASRKEILALVAAVALSVATYAFLRQRRSGTA